MEKELISQPKILRNGGITLNRKALEHLGVHVGQHVIVRKGPDNTLVLHGAILVVMEKLAISTVKAIARENDEFTTDDVRDLLEKSEEE